MQPAKMTVFCLSKAVKGMYPLGMFFCKSGLTASLISERYLRHASSLVIKLLKLETVDLVHFPVVTFRDSSLIGMIGSASKKV